MGYDQDNDGLHKAARREFMTLDMKPVVCPLFILFFRCLTWGREEKERREKKKRKKKEKEKNETQHPSVAHKEGKTSFRVTLTLGQVSRS